VHRANVTSTPTTTTTTTTATTTKGLIDDGAVRPHCSPFGLPIGVKGRLAGWYMSLPDRQHRELATLIPVEQATSLVEIGFGPGSTMRTLHRRNPAMRLAGVEPSDVMLAAAHTRNPTAALHLGAAAAMPFDDATADVVLSVNNLPMWPDLDAALAEIRRVLHPKGHVFIAWHGGTRPVGHQKKLVLSPKRLSEIDTLVSDHFPSAQRWTLHHSELWTTVTRPATAASG
jgi:SAM-dependent methyltransferase